MAQIDHILHLDGGVMSVDLGRVRGFATGPLVKSMIHVVASIGDLAGRVLYSDHLAGRGNRCFDVATTDWTSCGAFL